MKNKLFSPIKIKNFEFSNRFVLSPVTLNSATSDGHPTQEEVEYAKRRAHSAPLAITTGTYVNHEGQLFEFGFGATTDEHIQSLSKVAQAMKSKGAKAILQLAHAGRFSSVSLNRLGYVKGPSRLTFMFPKKHEVIEMTKEDIQQTIKDYQNATIRAIKAGFDGIEISSAQKLLPQAFFSKLSNFRNDEYGTQNINNRARFTIELLSAIASTIKEHASSDFILGYRATAEETRGDELGYPVEDFLELIDMIITKVPIDYLALASWGKDIYKFKVRSQGQYYNQNINKVVYEHLNNRLVLIASGGINTFEKCVEAIEHSDMIGLSSVFVADPEFVMKIENKQWEQIQLQITQKDFDELAIPEMAFNSLVKMMDSTETLPEITRNEIRKLDFGKDK